MDLEIGRQHLVDAGLKWIVVHQDAYPPEHRYKITRFFDLTATRTYTDAELVVYRLDP